MNIYFNPLDKACKSISGALKQGETLQFNLFLLQNEREETEQFQTPTMEECISPVGEAVLHLNRDGEEAEYIPMEKTGFGWTLSLNIPKIGLYFYTFYIENVGFVSCGDMQMGHITQNPHGFLLTVYSKSYKTPEWFKGGIMYQIFPDRFAKAGTMPDIKGRLMREWGGEPSFRPNHQGKVLNNDFFGGNFKGIEEKLPYLNELGVSVLYLNPIFEAASNHRYDTSDYMRLDPILGSEKDFSDLIKSAETYGIKLILDGVFNHTGDDSVYFNKYGHYNSVGAYQSQESPYYSWYSFSRFPDEYASWWGIDILPEVNESSQEYQKFIFGEGGVLKKWLSFGIGGYRLDVADELPDFFLKNLRKSVKESDKNAIIIGEVWEDASNKVAYSKRREYLQGFELDSVMNYPLKEGIISYALSGNARALLSTVRVLLDHYPKQTVDCLMNILGTHDTARILTVLGGIYCKNKEEMSQKSAYLSEKAKLEAIEKLKMAVVLQYTLPGVPCIYYGDENGAEGHIDPFCRRCFDWEHKNEALIDFYQKMGNIRKTYRDIFKDAEFSLLRAEESLFLYKRENKNGCVYVFVNNGSKRYLLNWGGSFQELISGNVFEEEMEIKPFSYGIFVKQE